MPEMRGKKAQERRIETRTASMAMQAMRVSVYPTQVLAEELAKDISGMVVQAPHFCGCVPANRIVASDCIETL
jgi:hypothetical protein